MKPDKLYLQNEQLIKDCKMFILLFEGLSPRLPHIEIIKKNINNFQTILLWDLAVPTAALSLKQWVIRSISASFHQRKENLLFHASEQTKGVITRQRMV